MKTNLDLAIADLEVAALRNKIAALERENERLTVELTHRVGWEERALKAEAQVVELSEILDSHRTYPEDGSLPVWACHASD